MAVISGAGAAVFSGGRDDCRFRRVSPLFLLPAARRGSFWPASQLSFLAAVAQGRREAQLVNSPNRQAVKFNGTICCGKRGQREATIVKLSNRQIVQSSNS